MGCEYEIFERLPDGTLVRHGCVFGLLEALHWLIRLRERAPGMDHAFFTVCSLVPN